MYPMVAALAEESESSGVGPGLLGFLVVVFLLASLLVLYRSMRKQIRKVDFDPEGSSDRERMRERRDTSN